MKRLMLVVAGIVVLTAGYVVGTAAGLGNPPSEPPVRDYQPDRGGMIDIVPASGSTQSPANGSKSMAPLPQPTGDGSALARNVRLNLYTKRVSDVAKRIDEIVATNKGTVYAAQLDSGSYQIQARIPIANYATALQALRATGTTEQFATNVDDVSGTIAYTEADLRRAQTQAQTLVNQIAQTKDPDKVSALEQQLAQVRSQIETLTASLRGTKSTVETVLFSVTAANTHLDAPVDNPSILAQAWEKATALFLIVAGGLLIIGAAILPLVLVMLTATLAGRLWRRFGHRSARTVPSAV